MRRMRGKPLFLLIANGCLAAACFTQDTPELADTLLPNPQRWPSVACTPEELARLRLAYRGVGPEHDVVAGQIELADEALKREVVFPPEGGQHNQWYQCDKCQLALTTIDSNRHRCPECGTVYSGYPYDNVIYGRTHQRLSRDLSACAWAYALTGDEKYSERSREILVGYAQRYAKYPYHSANMGKLTDPPSKTGGHVFEQTLTEASWIGPVCEAYDLVRGSQVFLENDHRSIREDFLVKVSENIAKHKAGKSNWQTYHNAAFIMIGGVLNRVDLVRQGIEDPENGFYFQMKASVLEGGMWYENSWGYHFYTLGAIERIVETARRLGIDLYATPPLKDMYSVALDYRMADGTLPRFGDATTTGVPPNRYESAYHRWKEQAFLSVLQESPTWDSVLLGRKDKRPIELDPLTSTLHSGAGHAILRVAGSTAAFTFGPFGGFHGHFDKLSFVYFSQGKEMAYDPGRARSQAYRLPVHKNWYRATTSHNTVLVDRVSQEGAEGQCELFVAAPELSAIAAHTDTAYPGVMHRRLLVLRPGFLVVADILTSTDGENHSFDWLYHNRGERISSPVATRKAAPPQGQGFEYLKDVRRGNTEGPIESTVSIGANRVRIIVNGEPGSEVLVGTGVGESVLDRVPLVCVTRNGRGARFAVAVDPSENGSAEEVEKIEIRNHESSGYLIQIRLRGGVEEIYAYDPEGVDRNVAGLKTRSKLLCLRREIGRSAQILAEAKN